MSVVTENSAYRGERAMHVGFSPVFMNTSGAMPTSSAQARVAACDLAEPWALTSIWRRNIISLRLRVTPNVLAVPDLYGGRTKNGTAGLDGRVLPWHNPLRVVEDVTQLDYYSGGRAILGSDGAWAPWSSPASAIEK